MRRFALLALPLGLLLSLPAAAQHWNDSPPGRDLLSSTITDFENFRERAPAPPSFSSRGAPVADSTARGPIPLLDWVPPPPVAAAPPRPQRRSPPRRTVRRATPPVERESAALPARSTPQRQAASVSGGGDWERSLADRERELQRLRRILEDDRLRYQQDRQPQLQ
ncbi:hypothetical protein [Falsiroseomonas sp. E2-1-a20]|uniref:hypothetical protein n=1 Tax=Falsiroseomonas sp. E2-1-a20 TaxID=3239300 RepID=UPI003F2CE520